VLLVDGIGPQLGAKVSPWNLRNSVFEGLEFTFKPAVENDEISPATFDEPTLHHVTEVVADRRLPVVRAGTVGTKIGDIFRLIFEA